MLWNKVKDTFGVNFQVPDQLATKRAMLKVFGINIRPSWHHFTRHTTGKGDVQKRMQPEAVFGPKTTRRPHEMMDNLGKRFTISINRSTKKNTNVL